MYSGGCSINFVNAMKCPVKSRHKPSVSNLKVSLCVQVILGLPLMYVSLKSVIKSTPFVPTRPSDGEVNK